MIPPIADSNKFVMQIGVDKHYLQLDHLDVREM